MMAPLALYPDSLLAQVLMAATYPGAVADASVWSKAHPQLSGDEAVRQVASQPWDPSVQSLVAFPAVLATLGQDPAWVQRVGDAFLAQPDAVMDSVQRLRRQAQAAGNLQSNDQQKVSVQAAPPPPPASTTTVVQQAPPQQTIVIEPTNPQVVYVASYHPNVVYGTWPYPAAPPVYTPPPPGYYVGTALLSGMAFATGVAVVNSLWGDCDWHHGDVDIDVNRYNNINVNRQLNANQNVWQHNPVHRDGVPYRDPASRERYDRRLADGGQRDAYRGLDPARSAERERARESLAQRGIASPATSNRQALERAQTAGREMRNDPQARQRAQAELQARQQGGGHQQLRERAAGNREAATRPRASSAGAQRPLSSQHNSQARQQFRQQHASQGVRNNAFAGARQPTQARQQIYRGQASQMAASRPHAGGAGRPVQRPAGGGFHRR